jgi:hypothetical protein
MSGSLFFSVIFHFLTAVLLNSHPYCHALAWRFKWVPELAPEASTACFVVIVAFDYD